MRKDRWDTTYSATVSERLFRLLMKLILNFVCESCEDLMIHGLSSFYGSQNALKEQCLLSVDGKVWCDGLRPVTLLRQRLKRIDYSGLKRLISPLMSYIMMAHEKFCRGRTRTSSRKCQTSTQHVWLWDRLIVLMARWFRTKLDRVVNRIDYPM